MSPRAETIVDREVGLRVNRPKWQAAIKEGCSRGWLSQKGNLVTATEQGIELVARVVGDDIASPASVILSAILSYGPEALLAGDKVRSGVSASSLRRLSVLRPAAGTAT